MNSQNGKYELGILETAVQNDRIQERDPGKVGKSSFQILLNYMNK